MSPSRRRSTSRFVVTPDEDADEEVAEEAVEESVGGPRSNASLVVSAPLSLSLSLTTLLRWERVSLLRAVTTWSVPKVERTKN